MSYREFSLRKVKQKSNKSLTLGQCIAEMIAAQRFNAKNEKPITTIDGSVSSGNLWTFSS
jgi:hypothetical protein